MALSESSGPMKPNSARQPRGQMPFGEAAGGAFPAAAVSRREWAGRVPALPVRPGASRRRAEVGDVHEGGGFAERIVRAAVVALGGGQGG